MANRETIWGCPIKYQDDKKEKYQSHEAFIEKTVDGLNGGYATLSATGYGANKEEACQDLVNVLSKMKMGA